MCRFYCFEIGKAKILKSIDKVTIITHGATVGHALKAVNELEQQGQRVGLVNMHTIKPLDENVLKVVLENSKIILVFEEHTTIGGLGASILEFINENHFATAPLLKRIGVQDAFPKTGDYSYMLNALGLDSEGVKREVVKHV